MNFKKIATKIEKYASKRSTLQIQKLILSKQTEVALEIAKRHIKVKGIKSIGFASSIINLFALQNHVDFAFSLREFCSIQFPKHRSFHKVSMQEFLDELAISPYIFEPEIIQHQVAYIPSLNSLWIHLMKQMIKQGYAPTISIAAPEINGKIATLFPMCDVWDEAMLSIGSSLLFPAQKFAPPSEILKSTEFLDFKLKTLKMMDRLDAVGRFRLVEREAVFYSTFFYCYSQLIEKRIELVVSAHAPHSPSSIILYEAAKFLKIKTVHFVDNTLIPAFQVATDYYGNLLNNGCTNHHSKPYKKILWDYVDSLNDPALQKEPDYMVQQKKFDKINKALNFSYLKKEKKVSSEYLTSLVAKSPPKKYVSSIKNTDFLYVNRLSYRFRSYKVIQDLRDNLFWEYNKIMLTKPNLACDFVYYPLHYEPEKTTNPEAGYFYNTYDAIAAIRNLIPLEIPIYLKEHYSQFSGKLVGFKGKSAYFYKSLSILPNVHFIDYNLNGLEIAKKALLVVSQTGTACLEAACLGKRTIMFGYPWFAGCPNIFEFSKIKDIDEVLNTSIQPPEAIKDFMSHWVDKYSIAGAITATQWLVAKERDHINVELYENEIQTTRDIIATLKYHQFIR